MIPTPIVQLYEADTLLDQPASQEAVVGKGGIRSSVERPWIVSSFRCGNMVRVRAVEIEHVLRFPAKYSSPPAQPSACERSAHIERSWSRFRHPGIARIEFDSGHGWHSKV